MTPHLRTAHRYIWIGLAVLLPAAWLAAILVLPETFRQERTGPPLPAPLPVLVASHPSGEYLFNLRADSAQRRLQVEVLIQQPSERPNTTLVRVGSTDQVLGLLGTRGIRRFELDWPASGKMTVKLRLEDRIGHRVLRELQLP